MTEVDHSASDVGSSVIDSNYHGVSVTKISDTDGGTKRKRPVGGGFFETAESLATGRTVIAIPRGDPCLIRSPLWRSSLNDRCRCSGGATGRQNREGRCGDEQVAVAVKSLKKPHWQEIGENTTLAKSKNIR